MFLVCLFVFSANLVVFGFIVVVFDIFLVIVSSDDDSFVIVLLVVVTIVHNIRSNGGGSTSSDFCVFFVCSNVIFRSLLYILVDLFHKGLVP